MDALAKGASNKDKDEGSKSKSKQKSRYGQKAVELQVGSTGERDLIKLALQVIVVVFLFLLMFGVGP